MAQKINWIEILEKGLNTIKQIDFTSLPFKRSERIKALEQKVEALENQVQSLTNINIENLKDNGEGIKE